MPSKLQITGFLLATLTISGVALAQQGGGGGAGGGNGDAGGGENSIIALRLKDHERLRVTRPVQMRAAAAGGDCLAQACNNPPQRGEPRIQFVDACGGDQNVARDRQGRIIRRICQFN